MSSRLSAARLCDVLVIYSVLYYCRYSCIATQPHSLEPRACWSAELASPRIARTRGASKRLSSARYFALLPCQLPVSVLSGRWYGSTAEENFKKMVWRSPSPVHGNEQGCKSSVKTTHEPAVQGIH